MENRKRPLKINVRFTAEELAELQSKADQAGLSKNAFIRKLIAGKQFNTKPPEEAQKLLWKLYDVGADARRLLAMAEETKLADAGQMRKVLVQIYLAVDAIIKFYQIEQEDK